MTWWQWLLLIFVLMIDQNIDHSKRVKNGVQIHDYNLANDEAFVEDLLDAMTRATRRQFQREKQDKGDYPTWEL
jgi:hypothetical protein